MAPSTESGNPASPTGGYPHRLVHTFRRLNERHYGALQGLDKKETTERHGVEQTKLWRRSYDVPPPPVDVDSAEHPINDPRYRRRSCSVGRTF